MNNREINLEGLNNQSRVNINSCLEICERIRIYSEKIKISSEKSLATLRKIRNK